MSEHKAPNAATLDELRDVLLRGLDDVRSVKEIVDDVGIPGLFKTGRPVRHRETGVRGILMAWYDDGCVKIGLDDMADAPRAGIETRDSRATGIMGVFSPDDWEFAPDDRERI